MLKNNLLLIKIVKKRREIITKTITITTKITRATITKKETTTRTIITFINKIFAYINQNYLIFSNAQGVANVVIDDNNNTHNNLISESEGVNHAKITLAKTSIAFELTCVNSRLDAIRARITRENTHIMKTNEDLTRVNVIFQAFINSF